jgi:two-component system chemotaxis response regulator CheB
MKTQDMARAVFPVVCVGGAASSPEGYIELVRHLPADLGVAIVIINHLRMIASLLHETLPRYTQMPIEEITEKLVIQPDRVFILQAERDLHILNGEFSLKTISKPNGWPDVITIFLRSLAKNWGGQLIAVILSGYDGDGAGALRDIKGVGGITMAQSIETSLQPDMPLSAISSGCVDFILPIQNIAEEIGRIARAAKANPLAATS